MRHDDETKRDNVLAWGWIGALTYAASRLLRQSNLYETALVAVGVAGALYGLVALFRPGFGRVSSRAGAVALVAMGAGLAAVGAGAWGWAALAAFVLILWGLVGAISPDRMGIPRRRLAVGVLLFGFGFLVAAGVTANEALAPVAQGPGQAPTGTQQPAQTDQPHPASASNPPASVQPAPSTSSSPSGSSTSAAAPQSTSKTSTDTEAEEPEPATPTLPGIAPPDIYLNLEKEPYGFQFGGWQGDNILSKCGQSFDLDTGADLSACIYTDDVNRVVWIEAEVTGMSADAAEWLLPYVATAPFDGNDPEKAAAWVKRNWRKVREGKPISTTIGPAKFQLLGNGKTYVALEIKPAKGFDEWLASLPTD